MIKLEILKQYLETVQDSNYSWYSPVQCNCGLLLQSIGYDKSKINSIVDLEEIKNNNEVIDEYVSELERENCDEDENALDGIYFYLFSLYKIEEPELQCEITKLPFQEVVDRLLSYGFTIDELKDLEHLADSKLNKTGLYKSKEDLIKYIENWIKLEGNK